MATDIQIKVELDIVYVEYRGEAQTHLTTEALRKAARIALEKQSTKLLMDVRQAVARGYHVSAIERTEQLPSLGIDQSFRIAFLGRKGDPMLQYIENVAVNRGFHLKAFNDEAEAVAWLRSAL
jgi:DNA-binding phage protein